MKKVACKDINPETDCDFEATGNSDKEVVNKMTAHIKAEHPDDVKGMSDGEIREMVQSKVHE